MIRYIAFTKDLNWPFFFRLSKLRILSLLIQRETPKGAPSGPAFQSIEALFECVIIGNILFVNRTNERHPFGYIHAPASVGGGRLSERRRAPSFQTSDGLLSSGRASRRAGMRTVLVVAAFYIEPSGSFPKGRMLHCLES